MYFWEINIFFVFVLCVFFAGMVIPQILRVAIRKNLFDIPNERKIHSYAIPRLGGVAFEPAILLSILLVIGVNIGLGDTKMSSLIHNELQTLIFGYCAIKTLYLVGIVDDLIGVRPGSKFIAQMLSGLMLIGGGLYIDNFYGIAGITTIPVWIAYPFTMLLVSFIVNAINFIDGIDGLASGLCSVVFLFYGILFFMFHEYIYSMLSFAALGGLIPFFYYNVFGNAKLKKKIFMGDTGSLTIGVIISWMSIHLVQIISSSTEITYNPIAVAFSPLIVPCFDLVSICICRIKEGKSPFLPDKNHIHHKLLSVGMSQRLVMLVIIGVSVISAVYNTLLSKYTDINCLIWGNVILWLFSYTLTTRKIRENVYFYIMDKKLKR